MATKNLGTATAVTSMQDADCLIIETGGSIRRITKENFTYSLSAQQIQAVANRAFGIEWSLEDTVKVLDYIGTSAQESAFKAWCDTSARPCEIKKDGTDFAYLTNTEGVASSTNWATRADGSASHYNTSDKADYLQMVECENVNVGYTVDSSTKRMAVYFNFDDDCPAGFHRWFKTKKKLLARYDTLPNADGATINCCYGETQNDVSSSFVWSANTLLSRTQATNSNLMEITAWELIVLTWLQSAYYKTFDVPSARGCGMQSGGESEVRSYQNGQQDSLTTPHGKASGNLTDGSTGCRFMYMENPTDGKQWIWGAGWTGNAGTGYLTFDDEKANLAATMATANADVTMTYLTGLSGTYCKNQDFYTMPIEKGGSSTSGHCDGNWSNAYTSRVFYAGGCAADGAACGVFARDLDYDASYADWIRRGRCAMNR